MVGGTEKKRNRNRKVSGEHIFPLIRVVAKGAIICVKSRARRRPKIGVTKGGTMKYIFLRDEISSGDLVECHGDDG